jgi:hypothetical protein
MGRKLERLHRDQGSRLGRVVYRDEGTGKLTEGEERPWREVLAEARALAGPGATVTVHVHGTTLAPQYGRGYGKLTQYPVQLTRARGGS